MTLPRAKLLPFDGHEISRRESWLTARMTRAEFDALPRYDCSMPTGVAIGKRWGRTDRDGSWLGEMRGPEDSPEIVFREVVIVPEPIVDGEGGKMSDDAEAPSGDERRIEATDDLMFGVTAHWPPEKPWAFRGRVLEALRREHVRTALTLLYALEEASIGAFSKEIPLAVRMPDLRADADPEAPVEDLPLTAVEPSKVLNLFRILDGKVREIEPAAQRALEDHYEVDKIRAAIGAAAKRFRDSGSDPEVAREELEKIFGLMPLHDVEHFGKDHRYGGWSHNPNTCRVCSDAREGK